MIVQYCGGNCFKLDSGKTSLIVDPSSNRFKTDVTVRTLAPIIAGTQFGEEVVLPGDYEIHGMEIRGIQILAESDDKMLKSVFSVNFDGILFLFLGHLSRLPAPDVLEKCGEPDVLCVAFDGGNSLSVESAVKIVKQIGPKVAILGESKKADEVKKSLGQKGGIEEKFVFKHKDIADSVEKIIILKA